MKSWGRNTYCLWDPETLLGTVEGELATHGRIEKLHNLVRKYLRGGRGLEESLCIQACLSCISI